VKDPGPNVLEQIIKSNELLAAIAAAGGIPSAPQEGWYSGLPILYPVIFMDQRDTGIAYTTDGTGADWTVEKSNVKPYAGGFNLHLVTKTTTPAANDEVTAEIILPAPEKPHILLQVLTAADEELAEEHWVEITLWRDLAGHTYYAWLIIRWLPRDVTYWRWYEGAPQQIGIDTPMRGRDMAWHHIQIAIDQSTLKYLFIKINGEVFDLSPYELYHGGVVDPGNLLKFKLKVKNVGAAMSGDYFHQILITQHADISL